MLNGLFEFGTSIVHGLCLVLQLSPIHVDNFKHLALIDTNAYSNNVKDTHIEKCLQKTNIFFVTHFESSLVVMCKLLVGMIGNMWLIGL